MYCPSDFNCDNAIVYGHNMKNGSMFRALNNMTDKEYFWRHHIFCIDIGNGFEEYEVISCYETVETDLSSWQISFESQESYEAWLKNIVKRCNYDCVDYDVTKQTITLSTCRGKSGGPGRFIVHLQKK
jgi:sortase B